MSTEAGAGAPPHRAKSAIPTSRSWPAPEARRSCRGSAAPSSGGAGRRRDGLRPGETILLGLRARAAGAADPPHLMTVREQDEAVAGRDLVLQRLDAGLEELDHASAEVADQVVVVVAGA